MRQNKKRYERNKAIKSTLRTHVRKVRDAVEEKNLDKAKTALPAAVKIINRTADKNVIHKKKASRLQSRLSKKVNALEAVSSGASSENES